MSHDLEPSHVTNCHTVLDPSSLDREVLCGWLPIRLYLARIRFADSASRD